MSRTWVALTIALTLTACSGVVEAHPSFDLSEFSIEGPARLAPGESSLGIVNTGQFPHTLVVSADDGTVIGASDLIQPGGSAQLELNLEDGVYQFTCRIVAQTPDGAIVDHYEEGMIKTVSVSS